MAEQKMTPIAAESLQFHADIKGKIEVISKVEIKDKHDLSLYDVVRIPTQGGMHYSVITNIKRKQVVECYPITSTNPHRLSLVGCDCYPLQCTSENGEQLFLTSSRIQIPYDAAAKSFIRKYDNPAEIKLALTSFAN